VVLLFCALHHLSGLRPERLRRDAAEAKRAGNPLAERLPLLLRLLKVLELLREELNLLLQLLQLCRNDLQQLLDVMELLLLDVVELLELLRDDLQRLQRLLERLHAGTSAECSHRRERDVRLERRLLNAEAIRAWLTHVKLLQIRV
jgi:hypothetical protein